MNDATPFDNILRASNRALEDVIGPCLDPANPLAQEQLRLVCRFLDFVRLRSASSQARLRAELVLAAALAQQLAPFFSRTPEVLQTHLHAATGDAEALLAASAPDEGQLKLTTERLNAAVSALTRLAAAFEPGASAEIDRAVLASSRHVIELQRAWFAPLGLDPEAASVPELDQLLRPAAHPDRTTKGLT